MPSINDATIINKDQDMSIGLPVDMQIYIKFMLACRNSPPKADSQVSEMSNKGPNNFSQRAVTKSGIIIKVIIVVFFSFLMMVTS